MTLRKRLKNWLLNVLSDAPPGQPVEQLMTDAPPTEPEPKHATKPEDDTEPWVNIGSTVYDPVKGFRIELDWNEAFIQHLRESGVGGRSEEEVVQKWLGMLYGDLIQRLEGTVVERNSDANRVNDFL